MKNEQVSGYKSGYVAVVGIPNVGKSTLINAFLGQKIAAVSPRSQTTRRRQIGIYTSDQAQIVFVDTPGLHSPHHKLGEYMNKQARDALEDSDLILLIVDCSRPPTQEDQRLAELISSLNRQNVTLMVLNKVDLIDGNLAVERQNLFQALLTQAEVMLLSATRGDNRERLLERLIELLPEGPRYFPEDQITDFYERDISADLIREAALLHLRDEVPHGIQVRIDEYTERGEQGAYIRATLFVERESHKPIVIGQNGSMLKKIGSSARSEIEAMTERKVFLELRVKVRANWRDDERAIHSFGWE